MTISKTEIEETCYSYEPKGERCKMNLHDRLPPLLYLQQWAMMETQVK